MLQPGDDLGQYRLLRYHADFDGIRIYIGKYAVHLGSYELRGNVEYSVYAGGVLGGQRGDDAAGIHAMYCYGFDIGLDTGPSAWIGAGYGKYLFHGAVPHFVKV